jgi:hypothetical protein
MRHTIARTFIYEESFCNLPENPQISATRIVRDAKPAITFLLAIKYRCPY